VSAMPRVSHAVVYGLAAAVIVAAVIAGASPWILILAVEFVGFLFDELVTGPRRQKRAAMRAVMQGDTGT
jgi:hypothetical protein